ncbi:MAG TPA: hypothetical protein VGA09_19445 [Candidatus Binatia bacterium]
MARVTSRDILSLRLDCNITWKTSLCAFFAAALLGCAGLPVSGTIGSQTIETRVDSEVARYFLANYLAGRHTDPLLDRRIDRVYQKPNGSLPNREVLKKLTEDFSADFAALYLADQITRVPANAWFQSAFRQAYEYALTTFPQGQMQVPGATDYDVLIVPTYLYKRFAFFSGADLAVPRAALQKVGFHCYFVETLDDGPVELNAEIIMAAIWARAASGRRLIVVSASKSGAEVALALTRLGSAKTRHVAAWINAVGALQGTPTVDDRLLPDFEFLTGKIDPAGTESMATGRSRQRFNSFKIPRTVFVVNYFGIPTIGSISFFGRKVYSALRKYGPNDGVLLLGDMIFPGGVTLARLGTDHIHMNDHIDIATVALVMPVLEWLKTHQNISPFPGTNLVQDKVEHAKESNDVSPQRAESSP